MIPVARLGTRRIIFGIFGHKPYIEVVPLHRHNLSENHAFLDLFVSGPLARSASDLNVALDILTGAARHDTRGWRLALPARRIKKLSDDKVGIMLKDSVRIQDYDFTRQLGFQPAPGYAEPKR